MKEKCDADKTGLIGCQASIMWMIKAADMKMFSCGRHLNRVCMQMVESGIEYLQLTVVH